SGMARRENKENSVSCHDPLAAAEGPQHPLHGKAGTLKRKASRLHSEQRSLSKKPVISLATEASVDIAAEISEGEAGESGGLSEIVGKAKRAIKRKCSELGLGIGKSSSKSSDKRKASKEKENTMLASSRATRVSSLRRHPAHDVRSSDLLSDATVIVLPSEDNYHGDASEHGGFHAERSTHRMLASADSTLLESQLTVFAPSSPPLYATAFDDGFFGFEEDQDDDQKAMLLPDVSCGPSAIDLPGTLVKSVESGSGAGNEGKGSCIASLDVNSLVAFIDEEETLGDKGSTDAAAIANLVLPAVEHTEQAAKPGFSGALRAEPKTPAVLQRGGTPRAYCGEDTPLVEQGRISTPSQRPLGATIFIEEQSATLASCSANEDGGCACSATGFCRDVGSLGMYTEHADLLFKLEGKYMTEL
ncbi:hypothetical protein LPJ56_005861, partial [Coemansia sp. RSA 2599]